MSLHTTLFTRIESAPRRELYYFNLYRLLIASLIAALVFSPMVTLAGPPRWPALAGGVAIAYLLTAALLLGLGRYQPRLTHMVIAGTLADILAAILIIHALPSARDGISMMLLFNLAAAATLLPLRSALLIAAFAAIGNVLEYQWDRLDGGPERPLAELAMVIISYLALSHMFHQFSQRARLNKALAERHSAEAARLYEINGLIIRRLRTGVLLVDGRNRITLANEAASALLGSGALVDDAGQRTILLGAIAPELARRLQRWRGGWTCEESPLQLAPDQPEVQPRFARLLADSELTLLFLDDTSVVSRRAESLTLSAMGRFSASLAHEIRNPLTAINYAAQLLEESDSVSDADRRLLRIIHQQCQRSNGIVESVLGLARRERARPEHLDLGQVVRRFLADYQQTMAIDAAQLSADGADDDAIRALVDPRHLQQILTVLVDNALKYGRSPPAPPRVRVRVASAARGAVIDVSDDGPGVAEAAIAQLFRPFFTTSEHGTGLGLYIAQELCRANQARLDYLAPADGGACFRITLPGPDALRPN